MIHTSLLSVGISLVPLWILYQLARFVAKSYSIRTKFQRMQRESLVRHKSGITSQKPSVNMVYCRLTSCIQPMPPHHPLFGHLLVVGKIMSKLPNDIHGHALPRQISKTYPNLGPLFYVDTWPFGPSILAVLSANGADQITVAHSLPKFTMLHEYVKPMTGGMDLISLEGQEWKFWRTVFNPGFSANHLMTMVPQMLKDIVVFCEILKERAASGEVFALDPVTINLNLDIIGRLVL